MRRADLVFRELWTGGVRIQIGTLSQLKLRRGQKATMLHFSFLAPALQHFDLKHLNMQNDYMSFKEEKVVVLFFKKKKKQQH